MGWFINKFFTAPVEPFGPAKLKKPTGNVHYPPGVVIPDYRIYKLEDAPELLDVQKRLNARGLNSPWLRNEVWRYDRKLWGSEAFRRFRFFFLGFKYTIPMLIVTAIYEYKIKKPDDHHGGHGQDTSHDEHSDSHH